MVPKSSKTRDAPPSATSSSVSSSSSSSEPPSPSPPHNVENSAPPPLPIVALLGLFVAFFASTFPSLSVIDEVATIDTFTYRVFPDFISRLALGWIRMACALFVVAVSYRGSFIDPGWPQLTAYLPQSKLQRGVVIEMTGYRTQLPFTSWAWNLLGLSFLLNGTIALMVEYGKIEYISPWLLRTALLVFETAAPTTLLVASVVRYAIWPRCLNAGGNTDGSSSSDQLKGFQALVMHNANVVMALAEASLLGGLPVCFSHCSVVPFFGIAYILFSWYMMDKWVSSPGQGPQFIYFFFDTTLGVKFMAISLLSLLLVLLSFFGLFGAIHQSLAHSSSSLSNNDDEYESVVPIMVPRVLALVLVSSAVCRFRD